MADKIMPLRAATALSAELTAQAETIEQCTHCGRLVPEVNEHDECVLCVAQMQEANRWRAEHTIELLDALFQEARSYLHRDDVIELAVERLPGGVSIGEHVRRQRAIEDEHIDAVDRHNAEVHRLRALSGKGT